MKNLLLSSLMGLTVISCSNIDFNESLSDENDPLNSPLRNLKSNKKQYATNPDSAGSQLFTPGTSVETAMPDADFYNKYPRFGGRPTRNLTVATPAKVLSHKGDYTKVELNSGDVGYVPSIMLIEKIEDSYSYSPPVENKRKRTPVISSSDPPPPTEDEILRKIKAREEARKKKTPQINVPTSSSGGFVAPEPEVKGIELPSNKSVAPPTIPSLPNSVPQVAPPESNTAPAISPVAIPKPEPTPAPKINSAPPIPPTPEIKINKPIDNSIQSPINAPSGGKINQDAALELRLTKPLN